MSDATIREALEKATDELNAAGAELQATLELLEERTDRMHSCDAILHAVLAETDEVLIGVDSEGRIEAWSRGADDHFDRPAEDALGHRLADMLDRSDAGEVMAAVRAVLEDTAGTDNKMVETEGAVFRIRRVPEPGRGVVMIDLLESS